MPKPKQQLPRKAAIRAVKSTRDIASVCALARRIWRAHYVSIIGAEQTEYMLDKYQSSEAIRQQISEGYKYYLLSTGSQHAGYFAFVPDRTGRRALLSKIYVTQQNRSKGCGRMILAFTERRCRVIGIQRIWLTVNRYNTQAIEFYKHSGFRNTGSLVKDIGSGFVMDDYRMEKTL
jgi:diamine N-acetyltransferase